MRLPTLALFLACLACGDGPTAPIAGGPPTAPLQAAADSILTRTNAQRSAAGLGPLELDPGLVVVAQAHAEDMARRGYFSHTNPEGLGPGDRVRAAGLEYGGVGENIALHPSAASAMSAWMDSPGHRSNILRDSYGRIGIGAYRAEGGVGNFHFVQVFTR